MIEPYENSLMTLSFTIKLSNPAIKKITVVTIVNIRMTFAFLGFFQILFSYFSDVLLGSCNAAKLRVRPKNINALLYV